MDHHMQNFVGTILNYMPVGVALYDAHSLCLLDANSLFHSFLNPHWQDGRAVGHSITDWFPKLESSDAVNLLRTVASTGTRYHSADFMVTTADRGITYWDVTIDPVRDEHGQIIQLVQVTSEVTAQVLARQRTEQAHVLLSQTNNEVEAERKRLEVIETVASSVRESLDTQRIGKAVADAIQANFDILSVYIHIADSTQQVLHLLDIPGVEWNAQKKSYLQSVPFDSPFLMAHAHHSHQPIIVEDAHVALAQGLVSYTHPLLSEQLRGYVCVPLWYRDHFEGTLTATFKCTISSQGPEVQTLLGCGTHIASALAHARLHTAAENEHARLLAVLDQLPEGVMIVDAVDRHISYANEASFRILGISHTANMRTTFNMHPLTQTVSYLNGLSVPTEDLPLNHALHGEFISGHESIVTRPDGSKLVLLTSAAPLKDKNDTITEAIIVFQDITIRKSMEQHKNSFLSVASHELRTPITAIQGFAEILQMKVAQGISLDTPRNWRAITGIMEQSQRLTRLIESMLDISRIEKAQLFVNLAEHDLLAIVTHVLETQSITNKHHQIRFTLEGMQPTDTLIAHIDEDRIDQVLNNLIGNAIKYSPTGSEIEVGLRYQPDATEQILLWVRDQGIGIATNELPSIFERFHRANNFDRSISGLGIGLYLVNELVTRHGGRVWVESVEGQGSTFYVSLPLNPVQAQR